MHDRLVPPAADGSENPKKEQFVNGAANTLEAVAASIMLKKARKEKWREGLKLALKPAYLMEAFALCCSDQTGVSERTARRLLVSMASLLWAMQDRGLSKGGNASQGWGFAKMLSEISKKFFERDSEFAGSAQ